MLRSRTASFVPVASAVNRNPSGDAAVAAQVPLSESQLGVPDAGNYGMVLALAESAPRG